MPINQKIKIAMLATVTDFGGGERVVLSLIEHINSDLFEIVPILFAFREPRNDTFFKQLDSIGRTYHIIHVNAHRLKYLNPFANVFQAYRLLARNKFDLIHTHGYRCDLIGIPLAKVIGLPIITTCHGYISNDRNLRLYNRIDRACLPLSTVIITVSDAIADDLVKCGIEKTRIATIPNAVHADYTDQAFFQYRREKRALYNIREHEFVIGYVGRLSKEKGVNFLIEAASLLHHARMPVRVLIIGEGPQKKELDQLAKEAGMETSVTFAGFQQDVFSWLPSLDVFVLPSLTEGTPMALLEAMASGIPAVASRVGGVPKLIAHGLNGYLFEAGDTQALFRHIKKLQEDPLLRASMGRESKELVRQEYGLAGWTAAIQAQYRRAVGSQA